ncbi:MAG: serine/threonine protein kinase [Herminiimonas sp.]|nr:serine/threonine protein kinase [Herminiimonas sp.]
METLLSTGARQTRYWIRDSSDIAVARRAGSALATRLALDETAVGRVALVVTEAATNILKHAGRGEILIAPARSGGVVGVEVVALDAGPGMSNVASSMRDGVSTSGSYGVGLGSMQRLADDFDIYSTPNAGTAVWMAIWASARKPIHDDPWKVGTVCIPLDGEDVCGDAWGVVVAPGEATVMVADGLGHGPDAAAASEAATAVLGKDHGQTPATLLDDAHAGLRATRGAAVAVACIDSKKGEVVFAGIGNIAACVTCDMQRKQLVSLNGIVGSNMRKVQQFDALWSRGCMLIMHSDGLGTRWSLDTYPGLASHHPGLVAAVLYRDFSRDRDDATVLVIRNNEIG